MTSCRSWFLFYAALLTAAGVFGGPASEGWAQTIAQVVHPKQAGGANNWVSDGARVLDAATERRLNALLGRLEKQTRAEMTVVTIRRAEGAASPKQFATRLFNRWGVGKRGADNGVLVLLVMDARRIEVETGRAMERVLPADHIQAILQKRVIPRFKEDDYGGGVLAGVQALAQTVSRPAPQAGTVRAPRAVPSAPDHDFAAHPAPVAEPDGRGIPVALVAGGGAALVLLPFGAGALWRFRPRRCAQCGQAMRFLSESEDDVSLAFDQRFEEGLNSVDYRVWRCDRCKTTRVERAAKWFSAYEDCPLCRHRTVYRQTDILRHPSYDWHGESLTTRACRFPGCPFRNSERRILPRRQRSTTVHHHQGTSSRGGSSGSGGGGFGGGSSSGGGAGASW